MIGAVIMMIAYGHEGMILWDILPFYGVPDFLLVAPEGDLFISLADTALGTIAEAGTVGAFLVDVLPWCASLCCICMGAFTHSGSSKICPYMVSWCWIQEAREGVVQTVPNDVDDALHDDEGKNRELQGDSTTTNGLFTTCPHKATGYCPIVHDEPASAHLYKRGRECPTRRYHRGLLSHYIRRYVR